MDLEIKSRSVNDYVVLEVAGEVDVYTAPSLREAILEQTNLGNFNLVIDLSQVGFLDSTGLGVLVGALKRIRDNEGTLTLAAVPERILKVLRITAVIKAFQIADSVEDATK